MKLNRNIINASAAFGLALSCAQGQSSIPIGNQALLAGWDFNNISSSSVGSANARYSDVWGDVTATPFSASAGTVYFNGTGGSDNWPTVTRVTTGADIDRPINGRLATAGLGSLSGAEGMLSLASQTPGTKDEFSFNVHTYDGVNSFDNLSLSLFAKDSGNTAGGVTVNWFYSVDGGATKINTLLSSVITGNAFTEQTLNLSPFNLALGNTANVYLIGEVLESIGTANLQFDNVAIYGTALSAIPEPSTYAAILSVATLSLMMRRRRQVGAVA